MADDTDLTAALLRSIGDYGDQRAAYERAECPLAAVQLAQAAILHHIDALIAAVRAEQHPLPHLREWIYQLERIAPKLTAKQHIAATEILDTSSRSQVNWRLLR